MKHSRTDTTREPRASLGELTARALGSTPFSIKDTQYESCCRLRRASSRVDIACRMSTTSRAARRLFAVCSVTVEFVAAGAAAGADGVGGIRAR